MFPLPLHHLLWLDTNRRRGDMRFCLHQRPLIWFFFKSWVRRLMRSPKNLPQTGARPQWCDTNGIHGSKVHLRGWCMFWQAWTILNANTFPTFLEKKRSWWFCLIKKNINRENYMYREFCLIEKNCVWVWGSKIINCHKIYFTKKLVKFWTEDAFLGKCRDDKRKYLVKVPKTGPDHPWSPQTKALNPIWLQSFHSHVFPKSSWIQVPF